MRCTKVAAACRWAGGRADRLFLPRLSESCFCWVGHESFEVAPVVQPKSGTYNKNINRHVVVVVVQV